ncbi:MAG: glycosyltransferase family 4 protein [Thermodesulfobacteriota bacterium]
MRRIKLLFLVTEDWYFCSHRLPLAQAAKEAGFDVVVVTRVRDHGEVIRRAGLRLVPCEWSRRGLNPFRELVVLAKLWRIYRREQPDIVHQVALKPVLYGTLAAWFAGCGRVVNAVAGLGFIFISSRKRARLLRPLVRMALRWLLDRPGSRLILQNRDDVEQFIQEKLADPGKIILIRGSGVDLTRFVPEPERPEPLVVLLASRLLWDKGVGEFVEAARRLRNQGANARFVLVGDGDSENPATIPRQQLAAWKEAGDIEWWGRRDDMPQILGMAHIVCLPSYREGLPKVLLEAAACARPLVATDVPGCREIVRSGENGILVPVRDAVALAAAIETLLGDPERRQQMGRVGRRMVEEGFAQEVVVDATMALYREMMLCNGR